MSLGAYIVDEIAFPITRIWLADGRIFVEARLENIREPVTVRDGSEFRIHAPDGSEIFTGVYSGPTSTAASPDRQDPPAIFTIIQPLGMVDADDKISRPLLTGKRRRW